MRAARPWVSRSWEPAVDESRADLLVELGCEELPPRALAQLTGSFFEHACAGLEAADIGFDRAASRCLYSPRRMTLLLSAVAAQQPDRRQDRRGPALSAAFDAQGRPTPAALGFARSVGRDVDALETLKTDAGEWLSCTIEQPGRALAELLFPLLEDALGRLPVPKPMRWSSHDFSFVRPVHWLVVLHGSQVLHGELFGCQAGRNTRGHRIHAPGPHDIAEAGDYQDVLSRACVVADPQLRRARIADAVRQAGSATGGVARISEALLDEVTNLLEWPVAIACAFDRSFLDVPPEALIASMEDHQKFFPVLDAGDGRLTEHFIAVANLESRDPGAVRQGFERVVRPRLADARFFWNQDRKLSLAGRLLQLDGIVFQEKLGSVGDKSRRIAGISKQIAALAGEDPVLAERAGLLCKCDLVSLMVGEFPELQGTMGAYYATASGEPGPVSAAIGSHYQPRHSGDALPGDALGRLVALADRMDTLVGIFAAGQRPTGNRDPFALRRATLGVLRMLLEPGLDLSLDTLIDLASEQLRNQVPVDAECRTAVLEFMIDRLRQLLRDEGFATRQVQSVLAAPGTRPADILRRLQAVHAFIGDVRGASLVASNKRIGNILKKSDGVVSQEIDADRLVLDAERKLFDAVRDAAQAVQPLYAQADYDSALALLAELSVPVDHYFEHVMVMDEDPGLRRNRLAQLAALKALFDRVADFSLAD